MNLVEAIFLGLIQGITEFLPVSSSGHLVLFQKILGQIHHDLLFDVSAHLGTVLAVIIVYKKSLVELLKPVLAINKVKQETSFRMLYYIVIASIPTAVIGFSFRHFFEGLFSNMQAVGGAFLFTGFVLLFTKSLGGNRKVLDMSNGLEGLSTLDAKKAFIIGCSQALAICPGISRAGMTVATGLFLKVRKDTATFFSFLIAIPAISGAMLLQVISSSNISKESLALYAIGFISSFVFGYAGLRALIQIVKRGNLALFSFYLFALGLVCLWGLPS